LALRRGGVGLAVTVDYGQRAARREMERASALCAAHGVRHEAIEAKWLGRYSRDALTTPGTALPDVAAETEGAGGGEPAPARDDASLRALWVPNRNGLLANVGACLAEALGMGYVVMGLNAEEGAVFPDNSPAFIRETNRAFSYSTLSGVRLRSFTRNMNKMEILAKALACGLDFRHLWSCYNGGELMCGSCPSCARLLAAAEGLGVRERLKGYFESGRPPQGDAGQRGEIP
jgi:7-cyano-7-deazaguanine synthase